MLLSNPWSLSLNKILDCTRRDSIGPSHHLLKYRDAGSALLHL